MRRGGHPGPSNPPASLIPGALAGSVRRRRARDGPRPEGRVALARFPVRGAEGLNLRARAGPVNGVGGPKIPQRLT